MAFNNDIRLRKHKPSVHETKSELTSLTLNTNREANKQTPGNKAPFLTEPSSDNQQPQPLYKTSINRSHQSQEDLQHIFIITNILNFQVKRIIRKILWLILNLSFIKKHSLT